MRVPCVGVTMLAGLPVLGTRDEWGQFARHASLNVQMPNSGHSCITIFQHNSFCHVVHQFVKSDAVMFFQLLYFPDFILPNFVHPRWKAQTSDIVLRFKYLCRFVAGHCDFKKGSEQLYRHWQLGVAPEGWWRFPICTWAGIWLLSQAFLRVKYILKFELWWLLFRSLWLKSLLDSLLLWSFLISRWMSSLPPCKSILRDPDM